MERRLRVKKHAEFDQIIGEGFKIKGPNLLVFYRHAEGQGRVGIAVSKKNGGAVTRVKIKRQIRAMLAHCYDFSKKADIVIIVKPNYRAGEFENNQTELIGLLGQIED